MCIYIHCVYVYIYIYIYTIFWDVIWPQVCIHPINKLALNNIICCYTNIINNDINCHRSVYTILRDSCVTQRQRSPRERWTARTTLRCGDAPRRPSKPMTMTLMTQTMSLRSSPESTRSVPSSRMPAGHRPWAGQRSAAEVIAWLTSWSNKGYLLGTCWNDWGTNWRRKEMRKGRGLVGTTKIRDISGGNNQAQAWLNKWDISHGIK